MSEKLTDQEKLAQDLEKTDKAVSAEEMVVKRPTEMEVVESQERTVREGFFSRRKTRTS